MVAGHSFGGVTAIGIGAQDERIKTVLTLDPWLLTVKNETLKLDKPF